MATSPPETVTDSWNGTTYNIGVQITGTAFAGRVRARVERGQIAADVTLVPMGNSLRVTLAPHGTDVREVTSCCETLEPQIQIMDAPAEMLNAEM